METIRTTLSRKRKKLVITMMLGCLLLFAGMIATTLSQWFWILCLGGGLIIAIANFILWFRMPCPSCGGNLGHAVNTPNWSGKINWSLAIPDQIRVCQYCGVSFDKEIGN